MNILILNWRDIINPESGGAEVLTHEMAKRWVKQGVEVVQFSAAFKGASAQEVLDGVKIIRDGSADIRSLNIPVHIAAYNWYRRQKRGRFDVVIDEIHGIPFFTPWYVKGKKVALICEVADQIWNAAFSFPINVMGRAIERSYFGFYRDIPFLTISPSTKVELLHMGLRNQQVTVLPMGVSLPKSSTTHRKEKDPTMIFVARLTKAKGIEDALGVVCRLISRFPKIRLWVVGQGSKKYMEYIEHAAEKMGIKDRVTFFGFVSQEKKFELMSRAHILIAPSLKEGWGLTVPEAGYVGTPSVGYDVEGLRDVIMDEKTGLLSQSAPRAMAKEIIRVLQDKTLYKKLESGAMQLAKTYSWDKTAGAALSVMQGA